MPVDNASYNVAGAAMPQSQMRFLLFKFTLFSFVQVVALVRSHIVLGRIQ